MGRMIANKIRGMKWKAKISLIVVFALVFSTFMHQGWYQPRPATGAVNYGNAGAAATGTTSLSVPYPAGIAAGDLLVLAIANKYPANGPATPAGWTSAEQRQGGAGGGGGDSGQMYSTVFIRVANGTESGNLTVTLTGANTSVGRMFRYTKAANTGWLYGVTGGSDNNANASWIVNGAANPGITSGDMLIVVSAINSDNYTFNTQEVTAAGATIASGNERQDSGTANGDDCSLVVSDHAVTDGTATAAPQFTMNSSGSGGNAPAGASVILRIREVPPGPVTPNIEYGGYVPSSFTFTTTFSDNIVAVNGCAFTTNGTAWNGGTISGASPTWTCTASPSGLANGTVLTLNMRATTNPATDLRTATAISRTVDAVAPTDGIVTVTPGHTKNTLSWSGFSDAASGLRIANTYSLRFLAGGTPPSCTTGTEIYLGTATTYTHTGLTNGSQYSYRVCAFDNVNNRSTGATVSGTPVADSTPPTAGPVSVSIESGIYVPAAFTLSASFTDNDSNITGCEYATLGTNWVAGTLSGSSPTWTCTQNLSGLANGTALTLNMRATSPGGTGTATSIARTVDALAPTNGTLTPTAGSGQIALSWSGFSDAASGLRTTNTYTLRFQTGATAPASCTVGTEIYLGTATSYVHTGLTNGTQYSYRVCAYDNLNNLSTGATASATTSTVSRNGRIIYSNNTNTPQNRTFSTTTGTFAAQAATLAGATNQRHFVIKAAPTRDEFIAGYVTSGGVLYILRWNGTWTAEWNVTVGGDGANGRRFDIAYETTSGNAMVVYSNNTTGANELRYRIWNGTSWTGAQNLNVNNLAGVPNMIKLASKPSAGSNEIAATIAGTANDLTTIIWSGSAWGNEPSTFHTGTLLNSGTAGDCDSFDHAYESVSGDLLVLFSSTTGPQQHYRTYSGGTWSGVANLGTSRGAPLQMVAAADPQSDNIILAFNRGASTNYYAFIWNGSGVDTVTTIGTGQTPAVNEKTITAKWLVAGGISYGIVMWDNAVAGNMGYRYWSGGSWDGTTRSENVSTGQTFKWMDVDVDPQVPDRLMFTYSDAANDLWAEQLVLSSGPVFTWTAADGGTALTATLASNTSQNFSFAWRPCIPQGAQPTINSPIAPKSGSPISVCGDVNTNSAQNVVYQIRNSSGTVLYQSGTCSGISTAGWTAGDTFTLTVTSNNGCGTSFSDAVDTFILYQPPSVVSGPTVSSTATATHVDSPFTITARFNDNSFAISGCQYSINNGGAWTAATVSGSGAATDCTTTAATCTNGTALTILMRATNAGGTTATSSIARTCDTAAPTTTDNQVSSAWQTTEKTVTLTPNDGTGSGIAAATGIFGCFETSCTPSVLGSNSMTTNCGVNNACSYDVRYYSVDNVGNAEAVKTSAFQARIDRQLPTAPTGFSAANSGAGMTCNVTWNPNASDGSGSGLHTTGAFVVRRATGSAPACGAGTVVCTVGSSATSCSDSGLAPGTYFYRLCVSDNAGNLTSGATSSCTPNNTAVRTVVGDGNSPSSKNAPTSTTNNAVSTFTLSTTSGTDTVTQIVVRIGGSGTPADVSASGVKLYRDVNNNNEWDAGDTLLGTTSFVGNEATFSGLGIAVSTTSVQYLITYDIPPTATIGSSLTAYVLSAAGTNPVNNNDNADATLTVILGCNRYNPTVEIFPSFRVIGKGVSTTYSVRVTNNDSVPCGSTTFSVTPTNTPAVPNANFSASTLSSLSTGALAPGAFWSTTLTHTSTVGAATGSTQRTRVTTGATANHGAVQSNEVTSTVAVTAGAGDGTLLKRSAGEMCDSCHKTSSNAPNDPNSIKMHSAEWLGSCSNPAYTSRTSCTTNGGTWTSKWGAGGWGISGGQYGEMLCTTCHSSHNTRNIYLIKETIISPNSPTHNFPGSTVDFRQKTGTGVGSMGSTGVYANSAKVCEVCHSQTAAHKKDQPVAYCHEQPAGTDCTTCHSHARGFKTPGNCVVCHSLPQGSRAAVVGQFSQNSHHVQGVALTDRHCYQCHWEANSDGSINTTYHSGCNTPGSPVNLVIYGSTSRPTAYTLGTTAVAYTANGTRAEMQKINQVCIGCHDDDTATAQPFGDGKTPSQYAWDSSSVANRYSQAGTTTWGKYTNTTTYPNAATKNVAKAYSAHGRVDLNARGWNTTTGYDTTPPNTSGSVNNVLCFDCHNSHGSSVAGTTTSYASSGSNWTKGGILKDTTAGFGGYTVTYKPADNATTNASRVKHSAGAGLCFDCHLTASATGGKPWSYDGTFGSTQIIEGYRGKPGWTGAAGVNPSGAQQRYTYKNKVGSKGSHFEGSSGLGHNNAPATSTINGLCTPCHDPHGVTNNTSRISAANKQYAVPLLKGTWMTSPYKEDAAPLETNLTTGYSAKNDAQAFRTPYNGRSRPGYAIDQNTFPNTNLSANPPDWLWDISAGHAQPTEPASQFGGLCLSCHAQADINPSTGSTAWNGFDRIHNTVKGWGGTGANANNAVHAFTCSKCHTPHHSSLPRLMITNCLDYKHRGRVGQGGPLGQSAANSGRDGAGWGRFPGGGGGHGNTPTLNGRYYFGEMCPDGVSSTCADTPTFPPLIQCHNVGTAGGTGYPASQLWNTKTPWAAP